MSGIFKRVLLPVAALGVAFFYTVNNRPEPSQPAPLQLEPLTPESSPEETIPLLVDKQSSLRGLNLKIYEEQLEKVGNIGSGAIFGISCVGFLVLLVVLGVTGVCMEDTKRGSSESEGCVGCLGGLVFLMLLATLINSGYKFGVSKPGQQRQQIMTEKSFGALIVKDAFERRHKNPNFRGSGPKIISFEEYLARRGFTLAEFQQTFPDALERFSKMEYPYSGTNIYGDLNTCRAWLDAISTPPSSEPLSLHETNSTPLVLSVGSLGRFRA